MRGAVILKHKGFSFILSTLIFALLVGCSGVQPRYHEVRKGETKAQIAIRYGVAIAELERANQNMEKGIQVGDKIYIPFESVPGWNEGDEKLPELDSSLAFAKKGEGKRELSSFNSRFIWPVIGKMSSAFGSRKGENHEGIDIAAPKGTQVIASRSGHVIYSGNKIAGYGNMVIVRHPDTLATVYAHLSRINIKKGQFVSRGQLIGRVGNTGRSTGPHLHFEVRDRSHPTDPLAFLPAPKTRRN